MKDKGGVEIKTGDQGETSLANGLHVAKSSARIVALGEVEEANAMIGLAGLEADTQIEAILARIQADLSDLWEDLCMPIAEGEMNVVRMTPGQILALETWLAAVLETLAPQQDVILPAGSPVAVRLYVARAVVRRAERAVVQLLEAPEEAVNRLILVYLNRLSDLLFALARAANGMGGADILRSVFR